MDLFTSTTDPLWQEVRSPTWFHAHISTACNITDNLTRAQGNGNGEKAVSQLTRTDTNWAQVLMTLYVSQKRSLGLAHPTVSRTNSFHRHALHSSRKTLRIFNRDHRPPTITIVIVITEVWRPSHNHHHGHSLLVIALRRKNTLFSNHTLPLSVNGSL